MIKIYSYYIKSWGHWWAIVDENLEQLISLQLKDHPAPKIPDHKKLFSPHWVTELFLCIEDYCKGNKINFSTLKVPLKKPGNTLFSQKVYESLRKIPYGKTCSYQDLAPTPNSARAVGMLMSKNPFILIYPCHRVIGKNGKLTGFSALGGIETKQRMLHLEIS